jgi:hypothetical protein
MEVLLLKLAKQAAGDSETGLTDDVAAIAVRRGYKK